MQMQSNAPTGGDIVVKVEPEIRVVTRTVSSVEPIGSNGSHRIGFAGADGKIRYALTKADRDLPEVGQLATFGARKQADGLIRWTYKYSESEMESEADSANA